jgi:hypothetical protein
MEDENEESFILNLDGKKLQVNKPEWLDGSLGEVYDWDTFEVVGQYDPVENWLMIGNLMDDDTEVQMLDDLGIRPQLPPTKPTKKAPSWGPKGYHRMPDGSIMKDSDMPKKKPYASEDEMLEEGDAEEIAEFYSKRAPKVFTGHSGGFTEFKDAKPSGV